MTEVTPFRGIVYNPDKIEDLADVTTPPYDVISEAEQESAHERHPQNIIRLILGKTGENDTDQDNRYTRAANYCQDWQRQEILIRDPEPAFYFTAIEFTVKNEQITRFGLMARVRLEPFDKGVILPHEKTFSRVKSERLELMKTCHANFSPIFSLYEDGNDTLGMLKRAVAGQKPDMEFTDTQGHRQILWRITDPILCQSLSDAMAPETLFIADGHHRYETALNYRDQVAAATPDFSPDHPANYVMMYLASMQDPGLIVFPAHRMLKAIDPETLDALMDRAAGYFEITTMPFDTDSREAAQAEFLSSLGSRASEHAIGVCMKDRPELYLMVLRPGIMAKLFGEEMPEALRELDVTVLTRLIFMELLGFDQARLDNEQLISYSSVAEEAIGGVLSGRCDITFILNPTPISQVQRVAREGLIMPRKSTYFYPKVITGQVLNPLVP